MQRLKNLIVRYLQKLSQTKPISQLLPRSLMSRFSQLQFKLLTPKETKIAKVGKNIEFPKNKYVYLENYLQMFYNSTSQNGRCNGQNLLLVTGAYRSGKSSLIRQSLQLFKKRKTSLQISKTKNKHNQNLPTNKQQNLQQLPFTTLSTPQYMEDIERQSTIDNELFSILSFDFAQNFMMKNQAFFNHIHLSIIKQIVKMSKQVQRRKKIKLLDQLLIRDIILANNAIQYIFIAIKDVVFGILNGCDQIQFDFSNKQVSQQNKNNIYNKLQQLNERIIQVSCKQFFGFRQNSTETQQSLNNNTQESLYSKLIAFISQHKKISSVESSLILFLSVFRKIQYQNRTKQHTYIYQGYQTGVQTTTFLFDILNYLAGFGKLNQYTLMKLINNERNPYDNYFIGQGNHIDIIMTFHHLEKLVCYNTLKFNNWLDNIIIQLHNASNLRTHFPVIIQLHNNYTLSEFQNCMRAQIDNPTVMQIPGYYTTNIFRYAPKYIFNQRALIKLRSVLGRNPSTWNQAILELSKGTYKISDILTANTPFIVNQHRQRLFLNKINKLYLCPQNLPTIDDNTLQHHIHQIFTLISKCKGSMKMLYMQHNQHLLNSIIFRQMYKLGLLYQNYYFGSVDFVDARDLYFVRKYLQNPYEIAKYGASNKSSIFRKASGYLSYKLWCHTKRPPIYQYFFKQLRYRDDLQQQFSKRQNLVNQRADYMLRQYFGGLRDHRILLYDQVYKKYYNL